MKYPDTWEQIDIKRAGLTTAQRARDMTLRKKYGISLADYTQMLTDQGGGCAICGELPAGKTLHVDHEHWGANRVRGLLCSRCNSMLAFACDTVDNLQAGIDYLLKRR